MFHQAGDTVGIELIVSEKKRKKEPLNTKSKCEMNDEEESRSISNGGKGNKYLTLEKGFIVVEK